MSDEIDVGKLQDEAWRLVQQGITTGSMTLMSGKQIMLDAKGYLGLVQWLANQNKKKKLVSAPEDFVAKATSTKTEVTHGSEADPAQDA